MKRSSPEFMIYNILKQSAVIIRDWLRKTFLNVAQYIFLDSEDSSGLFVLWH